MVVLISWVYPNTCNSGRSWLVKALCKNSDNCLLTVTGNRTDPININIYPPTPVEEGGARKGVPSLRGQTHVAGMRVARSGLRGQDERDKWKQTGSFWTRLRLGKAVAGSGVRSQTLHKK